MADVQVELAAGAPAAGVQFDMAFVQRLVAEQVESRLAAALAKPPANADPEQPKKLKRLGGAQNAAGASADEVAAVRKLVIEMVQKEHVKISPDRGECEFFEFELELQ
jgi:hypothetical protein